MNKELIILGAIPVLLLLIGAPNVFALSDVERHNVGWADGTSEAQADFNNGNPFNDSCPPGHSDSYCVGYTSGYDYYWNSAQQNVNSGQQTSQSANVNIRGNNNHVSINQQQAVNSGNDGEIGHRHHGGSGINDNCVVICLGVSVK